MPSRLVASYSLRLTNIAVYFYVIIIELVRTSVETNCNCKLCRFHRAEIQKANTQQHAWKFDIDVD